MQTPAGWYPDPLGRFDHRYWDGATWTEHVSRAGQQATDPLTAATPTQDLTGHGVTEPVEPSTADATPTADASTPDPAATPDPEPAFAAPDAGATFASSQAPPAGSGATGAAPSPAWPTATTPPYQPGAVPGERRTNTLAVLSLVLALIWILGLGSIAAIVLGIIAYRRVKASEGRETGSGLAIAGIVLGVLGLLSTLLFFAGIALFARDVGMGLDGDGNVTFDESALFEENEWARWTALYDTAGAEETYWFTNETYTTDLGRLREVGLELEPGIQLTIPTATADAFCLELTDDDGVWHLDSDFYEVEEGPCPLG